MNNDSPITRLRNLILLRRILFNFLTLAPILDYKVVRQEIIRMSKTAWGASEHPSERLAREAVYTSGRLANDMQWAAQADCFVMDMGFLDIKVGGYVLKFYFCEGEASLDLHEPKQAIATPIATWDKDGYHMLSYFGREPSLWKALTALIANPIIEEDEEELEAMPF